MAERLSASNAAKHMACHASAHLELAIPGWVPPVPRTVLKDGSEPSNMRGTKLHHIMEQMMEFGAKDLRNMAMVLDYIAELRSQRRFKVEPEYDMVGWWLQSQPHTQADLVLYTTDELHVLDLKAGKIPVGVFENDQMLYYALAASPLAPKAKGVTVHIMQPWAEGVVGNGCESWFIDSNRLNKFMQDSIATEKAILNGSVQFGPSDHCKFCPAFPHSRGEKGTPLCPETMALLYPKVTDEDEILSL